MKLIAWIYRPTFEDEASAKKWSSTSKYRVPDLYEIRFSSPADVPLTDARYHIPGWKRAEWLDEK